MDASNNKNPNLIHIVYISNDREPLSDEDIDDIERVASLRNSQHEITGLLLHNNGKFMQFLEGPKDQVEMIFHSIRKDKRHHDIDILINESIVKRQFTGWHMKSASIEDIETTHGSVYNKLFGVSTDSFESIDIAMNTMRLLQDFKHIYSQSQKY